MHTPEDGIVSRKHTLAKVNIEWIRPSRLPDILAIESTAFEEPWDERTFREYLSAQNCHGICAVAKNEVVGYLVYAATDWQLQIINMAVRIDCRRQGIGSLLVEHKMTKSRVPRIGVVFVRESNQSGMAFFNSLGFDGVDVCRPYDTTDERAHRMIGFTDALKRDMGIL